VFDRHIPEWRYDNLYLRYAVGIPLEEIRAANLAAKRRLIEEVATRHQLRLNESTLTIGSRGGRRLTNVPISFFQIRSTCATLLAESGRFRFYTRARLTRAMKEARLSSATYSRLRPR
jgi:hypothetical protein